MQHHTLVDIVVPEKTCYNNEHTSLTHIPSIITAETRQMFFERMNRCCVNLFQIKMFLACTLQIRSDAQTMLTQAQNAIASAACLRFGIKDFATIMTYSKIAWALITSNI